MFEHTFFKQIHRVHLECYCVECQRNFSLHLGQIIATDRVDLKCTCFYTVTRLLCFIQINALHETLKAEIPP